MKLALAQMQMVHVAQCEHFYEQDYYTHSEEGFQVFQTRLGRIGIVVCFDRHYPESIRTEALRGAEGFEKGFGRRPDKSEVFKEVIEKKARENMEEKTIKFQARNELPGQEPNIDLQELLER